MPVGSRVHNLGGRRGGDLPGRGGLKTGNFFGISKAREGDKEIDVVW